MKKRIEALKRIVRLQVRLHDIKRAQLTAIEHECASLGDELGAVFEALATGELACGAQARFGSRHVRGLEQRIETLGREQEEARGKVRAQGLRAKLAEQAAEAALARYRDRRERKELVDLVDRALARRRASSTQG